MKINTQKYSLITAYKRIMLGLLVAILVVSAPLSSAKADSFDDQIRALQSEVSQFQAQAAQFRQQTKNLQNQLAALQAEASALQTQINLNNAKLEQLNQQIIDTTKKIEDQKDILSDNLISLYLDSTVTPLEALASSKSISDFIDRQEYRETIRQQLQSSIATVKQLKEELDKQKRLTELTLADQASQREGLSARQAEQAQLIAETQGQEASYQALVGQKDSQIANLRAQQAAANLKWGGNVSFQARGGGYPSFWADIPMDSTIDDWLMYNRECVSYAAFKVAVSGRYAPTGFGNAIQWPGNARARGIPVDTSPRAGDIAVWPVGYYGHVMYVEGVSDNGNIFISEYNYDWTGRYSERTISAGTWRSLDFQFIHF